MSLDAMLRELVESEVERQLAERDAESNGRSPWLTAREAADYLHVPHKTVYNWTSTGSIPHRKIGNRLMFHRDELDAWLDRYREVR